MSRTTGKMRSAIGALATLLLAAGCAAPPSIEGAAGAGAGAGAVAEAELHEVVERHFAALDARDLDTLLATVTDGDRLTLILPDGTRFDRREEYAALHRDWFAEGGDWTMEHEVLQVLPGCDLGLVLVRTTMVDDTPRSGRQGYLALTFAREGEAGWRLVFDQNTAIPGRHPPAANDR